MVEERLVEAVGFMRRLPDRERAWLRVGTMSLWRQASPTLGMSGVDRVGYMTADEGTPPRLPGLTTRQVAAMDEALGWGDWLPPTDRRVVGLGVAQLEAGAARISWARMLVDLGQVRGKDGLRKRYGRGIATIAGKLNGADFCGRGASTPFNCDA